MDKKILYIDMDGVLADFQAGMNNWFNTYPDLKERWVDTPDHIHGIYRELPPIDNAIRAVELLDESGKYDMFIATTCPWGNPNSATDKRYWIERHFGTLFHKKIFNTHRKDLLIGDYLIDDRTKNGAGDFNGKLIQFGWNYEQKKWNPYPTWDGVLDELL